jgi:hypothetical protein
MMTLGLQLAEPNKSVCRNQLNGVGGPNIPSDFSRPRFSCSPVWYGWVDDAAELDESFEGGKKISSLDAQAVLLFGAYVLVYGLNHAFARGPFGFAAIFKKKGA